MKLLPLLEQETREAKLLRLFAKRLFQTQFKIVYNYWQYNSDTGEDQDYGKTTVQGRPYAIKFSKSDPNFILYDADFDVLIFIEGPEVEESEYTNEIRHNFIETVVINSPRVSDIGQQYGLRIGHVEFEDAFDIDAWINAAQKGELYIKSNGKTFGSLD